MQVGGLSGWYCGHIDGTLLFEVRPATKTMVVCAGSYRGASRRVFDLVIDLADRLDPLVRGHNLDDALGGWLRSQVQSAGILKLSWQDRGIPSLDREAWLEFARSLLASRYEAVYVCCHGGHGRTGTFLAILGCLLTELGAAGIPEGVDPVAWVRDMYCEEAVESRLQLQYIFEITCREEVLASSPSEWAYAERFGYWRPHQGEGSTARAKHPKNQNPKKKQRH